MEQQTTETVKEHIVNTTEELDESALNEMMKKLELTEDEASEVPLASGIRGQIKKLLRPYYSDQYTFNKAFEFFKKDVIDRSNRAISRLDYKNKEMYSGLVKWIMNDLGTPVGTTYVNLLALIDEAQVRLHQLESKETPFNEYVEEFNKSLRSRAKAIEDDMKAKKASKDGAAQKASEPQEQTASAETLEAQPDATEPEKMPENIEGEINVDTQNKDEFAPKEDAIEKVGDGN